MDWGAIWTSSSWDYLDKIGIAAALIAMVFSILIWLNQRRKELRDNALLDIRLRCDEPAITITLQGKIRRKNLTRAEVQGLLGILPTNKAKSRYELAYLSRHTFFDELEKAQVDASIKAIVVNCTIEELMQFDCSKLGDFCEIVGDLPIVKKV